jgi:competence protein ComEC
MATFTRGALHAAVAAALLVLACGCPGPATQRYDLSDLPEAVAPEPVAPPTDEARFYHFDVGQADATLVWGPGAAILIDAGDWRADNVVPYLRNVGVENIDLIIITHPHADHLGQVPSVLEAFAVTEVWMTGWEHPSQTFSRALDAVLESDAGYHEPRAGHTQELGELVVEVLNPSEPLEGVHDNLAVRIRYGEFAAIYTGDAETEHEEAMIERHEDLRANLLQLGHHGSRTSSSLAFLEAVRPELAIYSAAKNSQYNHPHPEVVERIKELGIPLYGTAESGTLVVTTDGNRFEIEEVGAAAAVGQRSQPAADGECIDINRAEQSELERIVHTGPARAQQIIELRPFSSLSELQRVRGFGEARVRDIENEGLACVK